MAKTTARTSTSTRPSAALKDEATRGLYAGAGVADLAVEVVKEYVDEVQKRFTGVRADVREVQGKAREDLKPANLRQQARQVIDTRVEAITGEAKARRAAVETRVAELQALPSKVTGKVQAAVDENVATAQRTYSDLAKRGENAVAKLRGLPEVQDTKAEAKKTVAKAKTTRTQTRKAAEATADEAEKGAEKTQRTAKSAATRTRKTAEKKSAPARSSAKATRTTARKTAAKAPEAVKAVAEAAGTSSAS